MKMIRQRREGFLWVPNSVYDEFGSKLHATTFMVYLDLCRRAHNDTQACYPSKDRIAAALGITAKTVYTALVELEKAGLIEIERTGRNNNYVLLDYRVNFTRISEPGNLSNHTSNGLPSDPGSGLPTNNTNKQDLKNKTNTLLDSSKSNESSERLFDDDEPKKESKKKAADARHQPFRQMLEKFYRHCTKKELYWTPADAKQLANYLKQNPEQTSSDLRLVLNNYLSSENINRELYPRQFLPQLNKYFAGPLDKFGKAISDDERTVH